MPSEQQGKGGFENLISMAARRFDALIDEARCRKVVVTAGAVRRFDLPLLPVALVGAFLLLVSPTVTLLGALAALLAGVRIRIEPR